MNDPGWRWSWAVVEWILIGSASSALAASDQQIDETIVDPIQDIATRDSRYAGNNLEPGAELQRTRLDYTYLPHANLRYAILHEADLSNAKLFSTDLGDANLSEANLNFADLSSVRLYSTNLDNALFWEEADWTGAKCSINALDNNSNPIADTIFPTGMDQAWRGAAGMVAVPEPTTALLLGLVGLSIVRWNLTTRHL